MKIALEIDGTRYCGEGDELLEVLTLLLKEANEMDDQFFLSALDLDESAILNYAS
jgi:hypothetical protein